MRAFLRLFGPLEWCTLAAAVVLAWYSFTTYRQERPQARRPAPAVQLEARGAERQGPLKPVGVFVVIVLALCVGVLRFDFLDDEDEDL